MGVAVCPGDGEVRDSESPLFLEKVLETLFRSL